MCAGNHTEKKDAPNPPTNSRLDPICIAVMTLSIALLIALFASAGFTIETLASSDDDQAVQSVLMIAMLAILASMVCVFYSLNAAFQDEDAIKRTRATDAAVLFMGQIIATVGVVIILVMMRL